MGIKNKRDKSSDSRWKLGRMESPYLLDDSTSLDDYYARYLADPTNRLFQGGRVYYKIFYRCFLGQDMVLAWVDDKASSHMHGIMTDELGHRYELRGVAMFRFAGGRIPDWYCCADAHLLCGDVQAMGEYLTNTNERICECLHSKKNEGFLENRYYRWTCRNGVYYVYNDLGNAWSAEFSDFSKNFQIVGGSVE